MPPLNGLVVVAGWNGLVPGDGGGFIGDWAGLPSAGCCGEAEAGSLAALSLPKKVRSENAMGWGEVRFSLREGNKPYHSLITIMSIKIASNKNKL